jgi:hypothetical protein
MANVPSVFFGPNGQLYTHGVAAAGTVKYLPADVVLTGSLVQQFANAVDISIGYDFESQLYLNVTGAGIVTAVAGVTTGTPVMRLSQLTQTTATASELRSASGTGDQTIASSSVSTGTRLMIVRGSALPTAAGTLFLNLSTAGTVTLLAGSTFRVFRSE